MSNLVRLSLSLEDSLLNKLSGLVKDGGYENRSEYVRDLIREHLVKKQWDADCPVLGTVTLVYNHHQRGLTEKLIHLQHHCGEHILASTHVHLSHEICAEMIMLTGSSEGIRRFVNQLKKLRGVLHAELAMSSTGEDLS